MRQGAIDCLVLTGPTAVGKTAFLRALHDVVGVPIEIISADAFQVYRGLDIGTAKPDAVLRTAIPHHVIDIRAINEQFNVADFVNAAQKLIVEIRSRGALPVVCGGTIYYIKHLVWGLPQTPIADSKIRQEIETQLLHQGALRLHQRLAAIDPIAAQRIEPTDTYRICRALEVWQATGRPLSDFDRDGAEPVCKAVIVGLTRDRATLVQAINQRVEQMMDQGLYTEFLSLIDQGFTKTEPGMRAIGYNEFFQIAAPNIQTLSAKDLANVAELIKIHTRQYAKRQMTFLRSLSDVHWLSPENPIPAAKEIQGLLGERIASLLT